MNRNCFISPLTHPAVRTLGSEIPDSSDTQFLLPLWANVASAALLLGWFLQESSSTPRGHLVAAGQDHDTEGASLEPLLVRHLCCGNYRRISWYSQPSLSSVDLSPVVRGVHLDLLCHVPSREAQQGWEHLCWTMSRQTCCSSLGCSPNPSCKLNCPMALGSSHMPSLLCSGKSCSALLWTSHPYLGFVLGSCSELTPLRWRNEARMEVTGQKSQGWICHPAAVALSVLPLGSVLRPLPGLELA